MKLRLLFVGALFLIATTSLNAQDSKTTSFTTAKEVIDKYIKVVGYSVTPAQNFQNISLAKSGNSIAGKPSTTISKTITVNDLINETSATIIGSGNNILRTLATKEKIYSFDENDKTTEVPGGLTEELLGKIDYTKLYNLTFLPNKEVFDDEECYVLYSEKELSNKIMTSTSIQKLKTFYYYSVKTGLSIGSKGESTTVMDGKLLATTKTHTHIKEYRLVDNKYLMSHKYVQVMEMIGPSSFTSTTTTVIKYNIDVEQFKNETFRNPRQAIAAIPDEL